MKGLIQRVTQARVEIQGECVGEIQQGLLLLLGIERDDTRESADKLLHKILNYRVFPDQAQRMNLSLAHTGFGLLIVSQFTLVAETDRGLRPGFSKGASPEQGEALYNYFRQQAQALHSPVASGRFGADMQVHLTNDGPVTFLLQSA